MKAVRGTYENGEIKLLERPEIEEKTEVVVVFFDDKTQKITWTDLEVKRLYPDIVEIIRQPKGKLNFHDALIPQMARESGIKFINSFDADFDEVEWLTRVKDEGDLSAVL